MSRKASEVGIGRAPVNDPPIHLPPIGLPRPRLRGSTPFEVCVQMRRSTRHFVSSAVSMASISQLLWAAQGVTALGGLRTAPSAGALYPLRTYLMAAKVRGLPPGLFKYDPDDHYIRGLRHGDLREPLISAGVDPCIGNAGAAIILAADYRGATREFGDGARRLIHIEAGHAGQNVCLQATSLGLGVIGLGNFDTGAVQRELNLREQEHPVYMLVIGRKLESEQVV